MSVGPEFQPAAGAPDHPVILFDGWCALCVGAVRFVIRRDRARSFRFAPLDSAAAREILSRCELDPTSLAEVGSGMTVVLLLEGRLYTRTDAVLRISAGLGFPWRLLPALRLVPRPVRDGLYAAVARYRHRIRGRLGSCHVPSPAEADRFL